MTREEIARVRETLAQLDAEDSEFWTEQGLPRVDHVATLAGVPALTRADITAVAPEYTRQNRSLGAESDALSASRNPVPPKEPDAVLALRQEIAAATVEAQQCRTALAQAQQALRAAEDRRDRLIERLPTETVAHAAQTSIQQYNQTRWKLRMEEAERRRSYAQEHGLNPRELAVHGRSRLDAAMVGRKGHGLKRPDFRTPEQRETAEKNKQAPLQS